MCSYVRYGGTAIALRLGHRSSVDFDFFSDRPLDKLALRTSCPFLAHAPVLQETRDTFTVLASSASLLHRDSDASDTTGQGEVRIEEVKCSFFGGIGFGRIGVPELT